MTQSPPILWVRLVPPAKVPALIVNVWLMFKPPAAVLTEAPDKVRLAYVGLAEIVWADVDESPGSKIKYTCAGQLKSAIIKNTIQNKVSYCQVTCGSNCFNSS